MNAAVITPSFESSPPAAPSSAPVPKRPQRNPHRLRLDKTPPDARRRAAAVLEVLAGMRTCPQAAETLGLSLAAYYNLEQRAMEGLVQGCLPVPKGRQKRHDEQVNTLGRQCKKLQQDLLRYQALVRAQQRSSGLAAPPEPVKAKGKRAKRPMVRAFKVVKQLRTTAATPDSVPLVAVA